MPDKKRSRRLIIIIFILTILIPGYFFIKGQSANVINFLNQAEELHFINPSVSLENGIQNDAIGLLFKDLSDDLSTLIKPLQGRYGIYLLDLQSGRELRIEAEQVFDAASTVKVIPIVYAYQQSAKGELDLSKEYILSESDKQDYGSGSMHRQPEGTVYSYKQLLESSGKESDNTADYVLRRILGKDKLNEFLNQNQMPKTNLSETSSSPLEIGHFWQAIAVGKLLKPKYQDMLYDNLSNTEYEERIPKGIPDNIRVIHKTGNGFARSYNDCGIVLASRPFVLCVMCEEANESEAMEVIPLIAQAAYQTIIGQ